MRRLQKRAPHELTSKHILPGGCFDELSSLNHYQDGQARMVLSFVLWLENSPRHETDHGILHLGLIESRYLKSEKLYGAV